MMKWLARNMAEGRWYLAPLGLFLLALAHLVVAQILGVDDVVDWKGRQVGFLFAPNWSISPLVLFPLVGTIVLLLLRTIEQAIRQLVSAGMVYQRSRKSRVLQSAALIQRWRNLLGNGLILWLVLSFLGAAQSLHEARTNSHLPLEKASSFSDAATQKLFKKDRVEADWAVASVLPGEEVSPKANYLFAYSAFLLLQGGMLSTLALFLVVVSCFGVFVLRLAWEGDTSLIPDPSATDERRGFEILEAPGTQMLIAGFCLFCAFYLTRVQNTYLLGEGSTNLLQLVLEPVSLALGETKSSLLEILKPDLAINYSIGWALGAGLVVVILMFAIIPALLLRAAANKARDTLNKELTGMSSTKVRQLFGEASAEIRAKLDSMVTWPFKYIRLNVLLLITVLLTGTLFFFKIAPYLYATLLVAAIGNVVARFKKGFD